MMFRQLFKKMLVGHGVRWHLCSHTCTII